MPRPTVDPRRLQKKTSQTMLAAQRRGTMEANRLSRRLEELQAAEDWDRRSWARDYRQAEQQLSLSSLVLSDHVISVGDISGHRPRAPSAIERRRRLFGDGDGDGNGEDGDVRRRRRQRQRRPSAVFEPQLERQRELRLEQQRAAAAAEAVESRMKLADTQQQQDQQQQQQTPQPVPCQFTGSGGGSCCRRFPCCLPPTYSFISNKREMLQLYDLLLSHLPEHKRPQSADGGSDAGGGGGGSDLGSMISDAEYLLGAQSRVSTLDPVERARLLRQSADEWKRRHSRQVPEPRETRYGRPYPMRRVLKPVTCSSSFFLN